MTGLQTARTLVQHEIPVLGFAKDPRHACCGTRVCKKIVFGEIDGEELLQMLQELGPKMEQKVVFFPAPITVFCWSPGIVKSLRAGTTSYCRMRIWLKCWLTRRNFMPLQSVSNCRCRVLFSCAAGRTQNGPHAN